jgi:hypothetical protein
MVAIRQIALALCSLVVLSLLLTGRAGFSASQAGYSEQQSEQDNNPSLFAQSAAQALDRDFPSRDVSFLLLDAHTGSVLAARWDHPDTPIPMGSLLKPLQPWRMASSTTISIQVILVAGPRQDAGFPTATVRLISRRPLPIPATRTFECSLRI